METVELSNMFEPAAAAAAAGMTTQTTTTNVKSNNNSSQIVDWTQGRFRYNETTRTCSVIMIGGMQVGKTALCEYWINDRLPDFAHSSEQCTYKPTTEPDFYLLKNSCTPKNCTHGEHFYSVKLYDAPGNYSYHDKLASTFQEIPAAIMVIDATRHQTMVCVCI